MNVLSLQSHVVYGHVGNSVAVFPLQRMGHEVWAISTVAYSNHPGHGKFRGRVTEAALVAQLVAGLDDLGMAKCCDAIVTGYVGDVSVGRAIIEAVRLVKSRSPNALYVCDPVMGRERDGFFVPEDLRDLFRERIVPAADVIVPNQFELEYLAGVSLSSLAAVTEACARLRPRGTEVVIVTSVGVEEVPESQIATLAVAPEGSWLVATPRLTGGLFGAGDLFAALFLGNFLGSRDIENALKVSVAATYGVLRTTTDTDARELEILKAQDEIVAPSRYFDVKRID